MCRDGTKYGTTSRRKEMCHQGKNKYPGAMPPRPSKEDSGVVYHIRWGTDRVGTICIAARQATLGFADMFLKSKS
jgi:hypothetical protein